MITNQKIFFDGLDHKIFLSNKFRKFRNSIRTFQKWTFINVQKWILDFQVGVKIRKKYSVQNQNHETKVFFK